MRFLIITIIAMLPFIQGCGLSGAYIYFGDRSWNHYLKAVQNSETEKSLEYLKAAYGNYNDSLTYDDTRYPLVYLKLADSTYAISKKASAAIRELRRAPSEIGDTPELRAGLGKYVFWRAKENPAGKDHDKLLSEAKDHYRSALLNNPLSADFNAGLLKIFFYQIEKNKFEANESKNNFLLTQVDDLLDNVSDIKSPQIEEVRGVNAFVRRDYKLAIEKLASIELESPSVAEDVPSAYYLARSHVEVQRYSEAIEVASSVLSKDENDFRMRGERTLAYYMKGDNSAGALDLQWMEKNAAEYHEFFHRVGYLFHKQNLSKKAGLYLLKAFRLNGENAYYAYALGENNLLEGNTRAARKFFDRAKSLAPTGSDLEKRAQQRITEIGG